MTGTEELEKDGNFHVEEISTEEICLIAPRSRHFRGVAKYGFRYPWIDIRQMENEKFIMLNKGFRLRYVADKVLKTHAMDPKQIEFSSIDTIWEIVSRDFGVAFASDFQYPKDLDIDIFSIGSRPVTWKFVDRYQGWRIHFCSCSAHDRDSEKNLSKLISEEGSEQHERERMFIETGVPFW